MKKPRPKLEQPKAEKTTRVQFDLPENSMARLSKLKKRIEATSYAEVVKNALRIYATVVEEVDAGGVLQIKQKSGKILEYRVF